MKLLHFSSAKTWRGGEQQIAYLYEELHNKGVEQWIFCPKKSALAMFSQQNGLNYITYRKRFSFNPLVAWKLKRICYEYGIDLVHIHDSHSHTYSYMSAITGNSTPYILSRRVDFPVQNTWLSGLKYNHSSIKKIIAVSNFVLQILAPSIIDSRKLSVIHSGIDPAKFKGKSQNLLRSEFKFPAHIKIIGNTAAIAPHKDYFTFIDTAGHLLKRHRDLKFLIIGSDGGEKQLIEEYIDQKKLTDHIILTGFREDIPEIISELDVFLFTSREEGLGTSLLEALASGIPVVCTDAGGVSEIIQHNINGLVSSVGDSQNLANHVSRVLEDPELKDRLIKGGKSVLSDFTKKETAIKTLQIYREVLPGKF